MASLVNNCIFVAASGGTGSFTVSAAATGYQTPAQAGAVDTKTYRYRAQSADLSQWEIGTTTASSTATVFTRSSIIASSNAGSAVNFSAAPNVILTFVAADVLQFDDAMSLTGGQQTQGRSNLAAAPIDNPSFTTGAAVAGPVTVTGGSITTQSPTTLQPQNVIINSTNDANAAYLMLRKFRTGAANNGAIQVNDTLGTFMFSAKDQSGNYQNSSWITAAATSVGASAVGSKINFFADSTLALTLASNLITMPVAINYGGVTLSNSVTGTGSMVLSASPTFTGAITATGKGHIFGNASGTAYSGALATTDASIQVYNASATNWAGIGSDTNGVMWFRTGLSGTPAAAMWIDTSQIVNYLNSPLAPTPTAGNSSTKVATTAFVATSFAPLASPTFTGTVTAPTFNATTQYNISGNTFALATGNYHVLYDPSARGALYLGNTTDPANYYRNTTHYFQTPAGATTLMTIVSGASQVSVGFGVTAYSLGNMTSFTISPFNGNYQYGTNHGAFTLTAPTTDSAIDLLVTNDASAGAITFSGFTVSSLTGDALTTTNTNKFIISIRRINAVSTYTIKALQ